MLRHQDDLERLPVPALEDTCELYLELVQPLLGEADLETTREAVADFVRPGGPGEVLQGRLVRFGEGRPSWLEPFWDDWYLCDDTPLPVNVSPGFVLAGPARPQVARAAGLLAAALRFHELVLSEQLEPDVRNGAPRCMREYTQVLCSTRVPGATRDRLVSSPNSHHVVVVHGDRLFALEVLDDHGRPYAAEDLERALRRIVDGLGRPQPAVGLLTTSRRRAWAHVREELLRAGRGSIPPWLAAIESAILLLVLESGTPPPHPRSVESARMVLHGDGGWRWFDKSIQLLVAANGVAGFCMEHAGFDGSTALRLADFLVEHETAPCEGAVTARGEPAASPLSVEPTEVLLSAIGRSRTGAHALVKRTDLAVVDFRAFGRNAIVHHALSPDGFVQMAFQLAYFTLTGTVASTYESVNTKRFLHGRTEAMRSIAPESVAFVRSLCAGRRTSAEPARLLRAAVAKHTALVRRCQEGRGVDRHLLGLRRMLEPDEPVPALYADTGYRTLSRSVLSTSSLPDSGGAELVCFGPVVDEGFGLSYTIRDGSVRCVVSNFHGLAGAFAEQLERALLEMRALVARYNTR